MRAQALAQAMMLVQPGNGAVGISTSPLLAATVAGLDGETYHVSFYGRPAAGYPAAGYGKEFTLIVYPDTQAAVQSSLGVFDSMSQFVADNAQTTNTVFATHVGDIVMNGNNTAEWGVADRAMAILDHGGVPYSVGPGNHDLPIYSSPSYYNDYFGVSRFQSRPWYRGHYSEDNYNNYSFFDASGMAFMVLNLQYAPAQDQLAWADDLLEKHRDRRAIVVSHSILHTCDAYTSEGVAIWDALHDNPNLFPMLCGHMHSASDGAAYRAERRPGMQDVHIMLANYQDFPNGGDGYLRILRFAPDENLIYATTYSAYQNRFISSYPDEMEMAYEMLGSNDGFSLLGSVEGVSPGGLATVTWSGLLPYTKYAWYAEAAGLQTSVSDAWTFTTADEGNNWEPKHVLLVPLLRR